MVLCYILDVFVFYKWTYLVRGKRQAHALQLAP